MLKLTLLIALATLTAGLDFDCNLGPANSGLNELLKIKHFCPDCFNEDDAKRFSLDVRKIFLKPQKQ